AIDRLPPSRGASLDRPLRPWSSASRAASASARSADMFPRSGSARPPGATGSAATPCAASPRGSSESLLSGWPALRRPYDVHVGPVPSQVKPFEPAAAVAIEQDLTGQPDTG